MKYLPHNRPIAFLLITLNLLAGKSTAGQIPDAKVRNVNVKLNYSSLQKQKGDKPVLPFQIAVACQGGSSRELIYTVTGWNAGISKPVNQALDIDTKGNLSLPLQDGMDQKMAQGMLFCVAVKANDKSIHLLGQTAAAWDAFGKDWLGIELSPASPVCQSDGKAKVTITLQCPKANRFSNGVKFAITTDAGSPTECTFSANGETQKVTLSISPGYHTIVAKPMNDPKDRDGTKWGQLQVAYGIEVSLAPASGKTVSTPGPSPPKKNHPPIGGSKLLIWEVVSIPALALGILCIPKRYRTFISLCPFCNRRLKFNVRICPACHTQVRCAHCNEPTSGLLLFCPHCGRATTSTVS